VSTFLLWAQKQAKIHIFTQLNKEKRKEIHEFAASLKHAGIIASKKHLPFLNWKNEKSRAMRKI